MIKPKLEFSYHENLYGIRINERKNKNILTNGSLNSLKFTKFTKKSSYKYMFSSMK